MKGLIIKDILNLRKILKTSFLMLVFFTLITYNSKNPNFLVGIFVLILTMQFISSIAFDEQSKWNVYALTMPISRKDIVLSKYIISILLSIIGLLLSTTVAYFIILPKSNFTSLELLISAYVTFGIAMLFLSILLPLIYKYGVEKSRMLMLIVISIPSLLIFYLNKIGIPLPDKSQLMNLFKVSPLIIIAVLFISINISYKIFKRQDM